MKSFSFFFGAETVGRTVTMRSPAHLRGSPFATGRAYCCFFATGLGSYWRSSSPSTSLTMRSISLLCFSHSDWAILSSLRNSSSLGLRYEPPRRSQSVVYWP